MKVLRSNVVLGTVLIILMGCQNVFLQDTVPPKTPAAKAVGRLAYIGADGNVYVTNAEGTFKVSVTDDATAPFEGVGLSYQRVSWSPDGQLAFAAVTRSNPGTTSKLYVVNSPGESPQIVGQSNNHFVIYIHWSPVPCPEKPNCRRLAYLIEENNAITLRLVELENNSSKNQVVGTGSPYYFSWAADGTSMLWHTGGTYRFNDKSKIAIYDLEQESIQPFTLKPASFMAPAWSPTGDGWLGVTSNTTGDQLQLFGKELPIALADIPKGGAAFVWSPLGDQVAYALRENSTDPFFSPIFVYDLNTKQTTQITSHTLHPIAFFWDPSGQRIAYLTHLTLPDESWAQWRVYNLEQNRDRGFKAFYPSLHMRYILNSFNQYAQSHQFWSPDGRYLVYGEQNEESGDQVRLIDTWSEDGNNSILVDGGTMGFWSWN